MGARQSLERSPSSWDERLPLIGLALLGLAVSTYLALYQWGVIPGPWDPIFGSTSSERALHSIVSRLLPIPDAAFGILAYLAEAILASIGDDERWHTRPWAVVIYGLVVLAMGIVSIGLVLNQGFVVRSWCTLCLLSAFISIVILAVASREAVATLQYLISEHERGSSFWETLRGSSSHHPGSMR